MTDYKPLTDMQKKYLWLMGSYPDLIMVQGRGKRTPKLLYAIRDDELIIFGYSQPPYWLENRGLIRKLQMPNAYDLTEDGEIRFKSMLAKGEGLWLNRGIRKVQ